MVYSLELKSNDWTVFFLLQIQIIGNSLIAIIRNSTKTDIEVGDSWPLLSNRKPVRSFWGMAVTNFLQIVLGDEPS